jgi:hypothetical protein
MKGLDGQSMMHFRRLLNLPALAFAVALLTGCGQRINIGTIVTGSGTAKTETRNVSGFSSVSASGSGTLIIKVAGEESLTIEADDNILPYLTSDVTNGRLELGAKPDTSLITRIGPNYTLMVKSLDSLNLSGSATAIITGLDADRFTLTISGSSNVTASGRADSLTTNISGSGNFTADALRAKAASVTISGSGKMLVNASDKLAVLVSGSGSVEYIGKPALNLQGGGSGKVFPH